MSESSTISATPLAFFCEHTASSRVLVLLAHPHHLDAVQPVLSVSDPRVAIDVAALLGHANRRGHDAAIDAQVNHLAAHIPDAAASSLRQALDWIRAGAWPTPAHALRPDPRPASQHSEPYGVRDGAPSQQVRLIDLPGKVVRVIRMVELHINDTNRFRAAAHAIGWTPADEGDLPEDDPLDLAGAAMTFADRPLNLPGADDLGSECMAEVVERYDDDVAAWALPGRIDIKFQTGWLRKHADPPASHDPEPDFATLYPIDPDTPSWQLTPRTASELYKTIRQHASHATEDLSVHGNEPVTENGKWWLLFNRLPKATWNQTFEWRRLIARAPTDLLGQLERGEWPRPVCPAEAIMLRLALGELQDDDDFNDDSVDLPRHRDDYNFDACAENLLGDNAVTRLKLRWDDTHGRISHAACRPTQWLQTFTGAAPRDPYRGLRPLDHDLRHRPRSPAPETKPARTRPWSFLGRTLTTRP